MLSIALCARPTESDSVPSKSWDGRPARQIRPMITRGQMLGAIAIGPKRSGEPYAPDESDAISELANGVATSLDVISLSSEKREDSLLAGIEELQRPQAVERTTPSLSTPFKECPMCCRRLELRKSDGANDGPCALLALLAPCGAST